jgi:hypothetical protein
MLALELAVGLLLELGLLQRSHLGLGEQDALLGDLGFERPQALLTHLQVVTLPDATHAGGRDVHALLEQLVGDANLPPRWLLDGHLQHRALHLGCHSVG